MKLISAAKQTWINIYDDLYLKFKEEGFSSNEADRRALLLVDEEVKIQRKSKENA